jgi:hypothetical protein
VEIECVEVKIKVEVEVEIKVKIKVEIEIKVKFEIFNNYLRLEDLIIYKSKDPKI